eukprot:TRINITY_DN5845_c0_g1_i1.p1 TRINITY_DN5845_c0_g1~~TRINITY_DN5845_c0_g1_i1.p1  ORF type:complete len:126 (+),score=32.80 TRINITY_DN5845_c0_g1_i1:71-448(+)
MLLEQKHGEEMRTREEKFMEEFQKERIQVAAEWEDERQTMQERVQALEATINKLKEDLVEQRIQLGEERKEEGRQMIDKIKYLKKRQVNRQNRPTNTRIVQGKDLLDELEQADLSNNKVAEERLR